MITADPIHQELCSFLICEVWPADQWEFVPAVCRGGGGVTTLEAAMAIEATSCPSEMGLLSSRSATCLDPLHLKREACTPKAGNLCQPLTVPNGSYWVALARLVSALMADLRSA